MSDTKPQSFVCAVAVLQASVLPFSSPEFLFVCYQGHNSCGTAHHTGWPIGRELAFPLFSISHLLSLRKIYIYIYIVCQLQFTLSNLHAGSKNVNISHVCLLALLEWFPFSYWKTLEYIDLKKHINQHWWCRGHLIQAILMQRYLEFSLHIYE